MKIGVILLALLLMSAMVVPAVYPLMKHFNWLITFNHHSLIRAGVKPASPMKGFFIPPLISRDNVVCSEKLCK